MDISGILIKLLEIYKTFLGSYGIAIILLVLTIKIVLFPLTIIGQKSMSKTQLIQPEIQDINNKYKNNLELRNQKITEVYAEHNISAFSPFLACLPILVSWPVIIALFQLLQIYFKAFSIQGSPISFLWISDISTRGYAILSIFVMAVQWLSTIVTNRLSNSTQPSYTKYISIFMIAFVGWLTFTYPASLGIYWFAFTFFSMVEQIFIKKIFLKDNK